ncbi:MAG: N-acetylmuramoyl-L-alanine amidase [Microcystis aeruginosa]
MGIVPTTWMPNCSMKRIIIHWTAGEHKASSNDKSHYHILIEDDGKLVRGTHSIKDNVSTADNVYAAHTALFGTGSIGVSVCCMSGAVENPFKAGSFPMTQTQWGTMAQVVAELCDFYDIEVTAKTVLGHGEVEREFPNKPQGGKWDPMVLPWDTSLSKKQVGDQFRTLVKTKLTGVSGLVETPASITAVVQGKAFREAQIFNEKSIVKIRPLLDTFNWKIMTANDQEVMELKFADGEEAKSLKFLLIEHSNKPMDIPSGTSQQEIIKKIEQFGFVKIVDLAQALNLSVTWDGTTRTVTIE